MREHSGAYPLVEFNLGKTLIHADLARVELRQTIIQEYSFVEQQPPEVGTLRPKDIV